MPIRMNMGATDMVNEENVLVMLSAAIENAASGERIMEIPIIPTKNIEKLTGRPVNKITRKNTMPKIPNTVNDMSTLLSL